MFPPIDGADEVDPARLIKGGGGALLREKIVASATRKEVIIADSSERVPSAGKVSSPSRDNQVRRSPGGEEDCCIGCCRVRYRGFEGKPFYHRRGQSHSRLQLRTDSRSARPGPRTGKHARGGGARFVYRDGRGGVDRQGRSGD